MFGSSSGKIDLPSMPVTLARVIQVTNSPDATADSVAKVVMLDQSLATKVLRLANSASMGRRVKVETITQAILALGFASVRNLAASASVVDALLPRRMFPGFSWQDYWIHSVTCAVASETVYCEMKGSRNAGESAFVAGLLHDIGKLILARALPQRFVQVVETCREYGWEMVHAESNILSTNHAKIGGDLAQQWEFPELLQAGIAYHHAPESAYEYEDLARAVQAGNMLSKRLCNNYLIGVSVDIGLAEIAAAAGLPSNSMSYVVDNVRSRMRQCSEILAWSNNMPGAKTTYAA